MMIDWTLQIPAVFDVGHIFLVTLGFLLLVVLLLKRTPSEPLPAEDDKKSETGASETGEEAPAETAAPPSIKSSQPDSALQLLSLLQKEARLIDFVQEDLTGFSDEEVGAAARVVHQGAKKVVEKHFTLAPVRSEEEESTLTVDKGFNPQEVQLTGNIAGEAPFTGMLVHKGWRVEHITLPQMVEGHDVTIIAPAEVEV